MTGTAVAAQPRVLLSAYQCAPGQGSVSQIGWEWYSRLSRRAPTTLVTHIRNRKWLEAAGAPLHGSEVIYIDTEWFARRLYAFAKRIFPRSEHSVFLLSSLDFFVFDRQAARLLKPRAQEWDLIHVVTPVSPSAFSTLSSLGLPVVRGPLNGGLETPANFPEFMRDDKAWLYPVRELGRPLGRLLGRRRAPAVVLTANAATDRQLTRAERARSYRMQENAVDPRLFPLSEWPAAPTAHNPLRALFVGRLVPAKALPLLFAAMRGLPAERPVELTVIGDGPLRSDWEADARDLGTRVRFLGACGPDVISSALAQSHLLCLPSVRESGGAVLLEALCAGRPVLAVNHGGPAEIVTEKCGRLVPASGPEAVIAGLREALVDMFRNPEEWRRRGLNGRIDTIFKRHTWDKQIERALSVYGKVLAPCAAQWTA